MITQEHIRNLNIRAYPRHLWIPPKGVVLGVNNVCNLHCKMCDVGTKTYETNFAQNLVGSQPLNMPLDLLKKVIDDIVVHFPKTSLDYAFTEPLVYPHLVESLQYAQRKNIHTSLTTNALGLKHKAQKLVEAGLKQIHISLDGTPPIHNHIRGHKSSFEQAIEGILELAKYPSRPRIQIICAITVWNVGVLHEFVEYFRELPIDEIGLMHTQFNDPQTVATHNQIWGDRYHATVSNIEETEVETMNLPLLFEQMQQIQQNQYPYKVFYSTHLPTLEALETYYLKPSVFVAKRCNAVFGTIMVKTDGSVIPAHGRCYNLTVGNVYQESLKSIWNSSILSQFRQDLSNNGGFFPACSRCCSAV